QEITRLFSDVYNARTLLADVRRDGADVKYAPEVGFIVYRPDRGTWSVDVEEWIRSCAQEVAGTVHRAILAQVGQLDARVAAVEDPDTRKVLGALVDQHRRKARSGQLVSYVESSRGIDAMLRELRALPGVHASFEDFDRHDHLLAVDNGVVDLESGQLRPFGPETKGLLLMRRVPTAYRADARCPRWERFVEEVFRDHAGLPGFIQRLVGYGITGHTTEQALAVLYGAGSNGKGVFLETLAGVFRGITTTTPFSTFELKPSGGIPNDIAALKGSRLVMASEGEQGRPMAEALIKRLTGGDTISARFMRREFFEFTPTFLILLATNYRPNFRGQDHGLWRRVKLIPFDRTFNGAEKDHHLTAKFLGRRIPASARRPDDDLGDGAAGILAWAVAGAVAWHRRGLADPEAITGATQHFRETSDNLRDFYDEFLVADPEGTISGHDVWGLYQRWCDEEGLDRQERWRRATFWSALEERGARKVRPAGSTGFVGIRRRRPSENAAAERLGDGSGADLDDAQIPAFTG
ncbi:MAG: DNA primase family protein, partial [Angustibacter sp.]